MKQIKELQLTLYKLIDTKRIYLISWKIIKQISRIHKNVRNFIKNQNIDNKFIKEVEINSKHRLPIIFLRFSEFDWLQL